MGVLADTEMSLLTCMGGNRFDQLFLGLRQEFLPLGCSDHEEEERELKVCGAREHHGFNGQKCEQQKEFLRQARQYILCAYFKIWKDLDNLTTR